MALIPARGGSKRFPRKNIAPYKGMPVISYTIQEAEKTGLFDRVVVSTDDDEIASIATKFGAETVKRPPALAGDTVGLAEVCMDFLHTEKSAGRTWDILCCLFPAAPLRKAKDIKGTVDLITTGQCDFSVAVSEYPFPPNMAKIEVNGLLQFAFPEWALKKRQDLPKFVIDNGSTYAFSVPAFLKAKTFHGSPQKGYLMPRLRSVDIDEPEDLIIAEALDGLETP
ncbi:pseudaminic acid cytidylyltransferase [Pseudodesulfovibrio sediminis]|uniref:Pseudaminic acid cytidylyltransferase n=2 Tax=Pseudodesulfovibrio sediminis TaxID=2810563 RepID=A0ABN6EVA1_9BACT|nr:pseudaminic acid cytidylyltransferase [Pseudodesulfovibrio sediminis]